MVNKLKRLGQRILAYMTFTIMKGSKTPAKADGGDQGEIQK